MTNIWHAKAWLIFSAKQINLKSLRRPICRHSAAAKCCSTETYSALTSYQFSRLQGEDVCLDNWQSLRKITVRFMRSTLYHTLLPTITTRTRLWILKNCTVNRLFLIVPNQFSVLTVASVQVWKLIFFTFLVTDIHDIFHENLN